MAAAQAPWPDAITIDTSGPPPEPASWPPEPVQRVLSAIRQQRAGRRELPGPQAPSRACCCPARPAVKVVMPPAPGRSQPVTCGCAGLTTARPGRRWPPLAPVSPQRTVVWSLPRRAAPEGQENLHLSCSAVVGGPAISQPVCLRRFVLTRTLVILASTDGAAGDLVRQDLRPLGRLADVAHYGRCLRGERGRRTGRAPGVHGAAADRLRSPTAGWLNGDPKT